jgi:hypothetical protein
MHSVDKRGRLRRALLALARWIGWWLASGLVASASLATYAVFRYGKVSRDSVEICLAFAVPGILLTTLLWRRRRESDGPLASMILGAGFWAAFWIVVWKLIQT